MVKIIIMNWQSFSAKAKAEFENGIKSRKFKKGNGVLYAESLDAARKMMTNGRLRLLSVVKEKKPSSLYQLAAELGKDMKTVHTDASMLSEFGLLSLEKRMEGRRACLRPTVTHRKITLEIAV